MTSNNIALTPQATLLHGFPGLPTQPGPPGPFAPRPHMPAWSPGLGQVGTPRLSRSERSSTCVGKAARRPQSLTPAPSKASRSPARVTLGPVHSLVMPGCRLQGSKTAAGLFLVPLHRDQVCLTAEGQVLTRYPPCQTLPSGHLGSLGKRGSRVGEVSLGNGKS